jgi:hypothetical protein
LGSRKEVGLMHARVAAFENPNTSRIDELVGIVRDRQSAGTDIPDALGMYMLVDRAAGTSLGISIFDDEEAILAAEPVFERMGDEIPETLRGKRRSVDTYEVAIHEVAEEVGAARVSTFAGDAAQVEESLRHAVEETLPHLRTIDGWAGIIVAVDRASGAETVITLWESEEAMSASERQADKLRSTVADAAKQRIVTVQRFDVPLAYDRAPRLIAV